MLIIFKLYLKPWLITEEDVYVCVSLFFFFLCDIFVGKTTVYIYIYIYIYVPSPHNLESFLVIQLNAGQLECHKRLKLYTHKKELLY